MVATTSQTTAQSQQRQPSVIYCIGESHSTFFSGKDQIVEDQSLLRPMPFFEVHHIGPVLAFNLIKEGATTMGREKFLGVLENEIPANAWVMPIAGEIDCRAHIQLQAEKQGKTIEQILKSCVRNYIQFIDEILVKGYSVLVYNVIPSGPYRYKYRLKKDALYPTYGSQKQRNRITRRFNDLLRNECRKRQLPFLENFDLLVDSSGRTKGEYYMDKIHLSNRAMPMTLERLRGIFPNSDFSLPLPYQTKIERSMAMINRKERTLAARLRKHWRWKYNGIKAGTHLKNLLVILRGGG